MHTRYVHKDAAGEVDRGEWQDCVVVSGTVLCGRRRQVTSNHMLSTLMSSSCITMVLVFGEKTELTDYHQLHILYPMYIPFLNNRPMEELEFVFGITAVLREGFEPMGHFSHYLGFRLIGCRKNCQSSLMYLSFPCCQIRYESLLDKKVDETLRIMSKSTAHIT